MKFTINWLKEFLQTDVSLDEIIEKLTYIGLEVESCVDISAQLQQFSVAQIVEVAPHPDADRLQVCRVNTGNEELQIVCGAPNARAGINVVLAPVGAIIPNGGFKIKASKIRGVESKGMLCSASELGLGDDAAGIIEMPASNDNIAKKYIDIAGLNDPVIEIAITPNRGDCLGVYGIARDLAAAGLGTLKDLEIIKIEGNYKSPIDIKIEDHKSCPLFIGRYFKNVKNGPSPDWLQNRLKAVGINPISKLVDITNYITFAFGRPLHVYDSDKLSGNLNIGFQQGSKKFKALDHKEYDISSDILAIADDSNSVQAIAGVIGGEDSGCSDKTENVFLEVALFDPDAVTHAGRKLDIITDSRYRFERNVDPDFVEKGMHIASKMIIDLCGGQASDPVIAGNISSPKKQITLPSGFIKKYSGVDIDNNKISNILEKLGFVIDGENIQVPSWRADVGIANDLVEEVLRIYGYDKIPMTPIDNKELSYQPLSSKKEQVRNLLASRGLDEVITWSFMDKSKSTLFEQLNEGLILKNPISSELDYMRPCIVPNLLDVIVKNSARDTSDLAVFEIGPVFIAPSPDGQNTNITGILSGEYESRNIHSNTRDVDIFDAKSEAIAVFNTLGVPVDALKVYRQAPKYYHPGRSGVFKLGKNILGVFGQIHPSILKKWGIKIPVVAFEIFLDKLPPVKVKKTTSKPKLRKSDYQSSQRDFAFIINDDIFASDIINACKSVDKELIDSVQLFDIYKGSNIQEGKKSIALGVKIQPYDRTLTDNELEELAGKIISAVEKLGGKLRK